VSRCHAPSGAHLLLLVTFSFVLVGAVSDGRADLSFVTQSAALSQVSASACYIIYILSVITRTWYNISYMYTVCTKPFLVHIQYSRCLVVNNSRYNGSLVT
jgi:hypothetical protein